MKTYAVVALGLLLASCSTRVAFKTDATVQGTDVGVLKHQEYFVMGDEADPMIAYRGGVNLVPVGEGLRGSAGSFVFSLDARHREQEVSFAYPSATGLVTRTQRFVPSEVEEVLFSRDRGILLRYRSGTALVQPRSENRMCTE